MVAYFVFDVKWHTIHVYRIDRVRPEVHVQIFKLGGPVLPECIFHASAGCPNYPRLFI